MSSKATLRMKQKKARMAQAGAFSVVEEDAKIIEIKDGEVTDVDILDEEEIVNEPEEFVIEPTVTKKKTKKKKSKN